MRMPFGQWIGLDTRELPDDCLGWLAGIARGKLLTDVQRELRKRERVIALSQSALPIPEDNRTARRIGPSAYEPHFEHCAAFARTEEQGAVLRARGRSY